MLPCMGIRCRIDSSRSLNRLNMMKIDKPEGFQILKAGDSLWITDTNRACSGCGRAWVEKYSLSDLLHVPPSDSARWPDDVKSLTVLEDRLEIELTDELSTDLGVGTITRFRPPKGDENFQMSRKIGHGCDSGDAVIDYLIDHGLVNAEVLYTKRWLESPGDDVPDGEDPSGFTEAGRELFEFVYGLIVDN